MSYQPPIQRYIVVPSESHGYCHIKDTVTGWFVGWPYFSYERQEKERAQRDADHLNAVEAEYIQNEIDEALRQQIKETIRETAEVAALRMRTKSPNPEGPHNG